MERGKFSVEVKQASLSVDMSTCVRALWGTWKLEVGVMKLQYICILCIDFSVPAIEAEV